MNTRYSFLMILLMMALFGTNFIPGSNIEAIGQPVKLNFAEGSWEGDMIGKGTVMAEYDVTINATINGTLEGTPQFGTWNGKYQATYKWNSHMENDIGFFKGNYSLNIDDSGIVTGKVVSKVSGLLVGDWELQINGSRIEPGIIVGTWTGKFIPTYFSYGRVTPVPTTLRLQGSGEFNAELKEKSITTSTDSTSDATPPAPSPIATIEPPPLEETITDENQILLTILRAGFIIAIIGIIISMSVKVLGANH